MADGLRARLLALTDAQRWRDLRAFLTPTAEAQCDVCGRPAVPGRLVDLCDTCWSEFKAWRTAKRDNESGTT